MQASKSAFEFTATNSHRLMRLESRRIYDFNIDRQDEAKRVIMMWAENAG